MKHFMTMSLLAGSAIILSSCSPVSLATGVGVAAGAAAVQEGGLSRAMSDIRIQTQINELWFSNNVDMFSKLDLTINQGRVLITGVVQNPEHRVEAVRLAWQPAGVVQVINEIKVADSDGFVGYAKDAWISGRLRTALILDREVESINYSIDTVQGTIYLMGFAKSQRELNHVIEKARTIENVRQVVSYVKVYGAPEISGEGYQQPFGNQPVNTSQHQRDQTKMPAAQPPAADSEPIEWSQDSIYE